MHGSGESNCKLLQINGTSQRKYASCLAIIAHQYKTEYSDPSMNPLIRTEELNNNLNCYIMQLQIIYLVIFKSLHYLNIILSEDMNNSVNYKSANGLIVKSWIPISKITSKLPWTWILLWFQFVDNILRNGCHGAKKISVAKISKLNGSIRRLEFV